MKISCQSCGAKYNIADEKVRGKIVKIACKKCGARIEIDGREQAEQAQDQDETRVYDNQAAAAAAGGVDSWTVSVDDNDQREVNTAQLLELHAAGTINGETFLWREGMADWQMLRDVEALQGQLSGGATSMPPADYASAGEQAASNGHAEAAPAPAAYQPPPAAYPAPAIETAAAARLGGSRRGGAVDLFAAPVGGAAEDEDVATSAPQPGMAMGGGGGLGMSEAVDSGKPIGARNENSVLFSLAALTASGPSTPAATIGDDEKSGLIDIQKLASAAKGGSGKDDRAKLDDIMNLGGGGAFGSALGAPILAPPPPTAMEMPAEDRKKGSPILYIVIGVFGIAIIALLLVLILKKDDAPKDASKGKDDKGGLEAPTNSGKTPSPTAPTGDNTGTAPTIATGDPAPTGDNTGGTIGSAKTPGAPTGKPIPGGALTAKPGTTATTAAPTATTAAPTSTGGKPCKSLEECMGAKTAAPAPTKTDAPPAGGGAEFDKGAAKAALSSIGYKDCGGSGSGSVAVTFSPSGSATGASVSGDFDGGVKSCVSGRFRTAKVPAFGGPAKTVGWKINF